MLLQVKINQFSTSLFLSQNSMSQHKFFTTQNGVRKEERGTALTSITISTVQSKALQWNAANYITGLSYLLKYKFYLIKLLKKG